MFVTEQAADRRGAKWRRDMALRNAAHSCHGPSNMRSDESSLIDSAVIHRAGAAEKASKEAPGRLRTTIDPGRAIAEAL
jgi:hypothetical protein